MVYAWFVHDSCKAYSVKQVQVESALSAFYKKNAQDVRVS